MIRPQAVAITILETWMRPLVRSTSTVATITARFSGPCSPKDTPRPLTTVSPALGRGDGRGCHPAFCPAATLTLHDPLSCSPRLRPEALLASPDRARRKTPVGLQRWSGLHAAGQMAGW